MTCSSSTHGPCVSTVFFCLIGAWLVLAATPVVAADPDQDITEHLRQRLAAGRAGLTVATATGPPQDAAGLQALYADRVYQPVWFEDGRLAGRAGLIARVLAAAHEDGLHPDDYHAAALVRAMEEAGAGTPAERASLELALTDAVLAYASDVLLGRVRPETLFPNWESAPRDADPVRTVQGILASDAPVDALRGLAPGHRNYQRLRELLARFRRIERAGGWVTVPSGPALKPGVHSPRVAALRARLEQSGDLLDPQTGGSTDTVDTTLQAAVQRYQTRHGLEPDGIAGAATIESLNMPVTERIRTVELNMERWRWLPRDLGDRFITVNIAGFELTLVEHGEAQLVTPVVVGKRYHATPVFTGRMTYLVFSPYWNVPSSIATREILPKLKQNPVYLEEESMKVFRGWQQPAAALDPADIDWSTVPAKGFPFRFRQEPGPGNALGQVKFMFPNKYNVYLHDTPAKALFARASRDFSHGCIRVKEPLRLANYLLQDQWSPQQVAAAANRGVEQSVSLTRPWPVHIQYWTAWVSERGDIHFRPDVYARDERLAQALYH